MKKVTKIISLVLALSIILSSNLFITANASSTAFNPNVFQFSYLKDSETTFTVNSTTCKISNLPNDEKYNYIWLRLNTVANDDFVDGGVSANDRNNNNTATFNTANVPNGRYYLNVYTSTQQYSTYSSYLYKQLTATVTNGVIQFDKPYVYDNNASYYDSHIVVDEYTKNYYDYYALNQCSKSERIQLTKLANEIVGNETDDYNKVKLIHDWIADNIYYDYDYLNGITETTQYRPADILKSKKAVCAGYGNLMSALCTVLGIQSRYIVGYGGTLTADNYNSVDYNHAWNEIFVDNRWIIVDSTWDSLNKYSKGTYTKATHIDTYFDCSKEFFAGNHKATIYPDPPSFYLDADIPLAYQIKPNTPISATDMKLPTTGTVHTKYGDFTLDLEWYFTYEFTYDPAQNYADGTTFDLFGYAWLPEELKQYPEFKDVNNFGWWSTLIIDSTIVFGSNVSGYAGTDVGNDTVVTDVFDVSLVKDNLTVATTKTDSDGYFQFAQVQDGNYQLVISGKYALTRTIDIEIKSSDLTVSDAENKIAIINCDYNSDSFITASDYLLFGNQMGKVVTDETSQFDINNDGYINAGDYLIFNVFMGFSTASYS